MIPVFMVLLVCVPSKNNLGAHWKPASAFGAAGACRGNRPRVRKKMTPKIKRAFKYRTVLDLSSSPSRRQQDDDGSGGEDK